MERKLYRRRKDRMVAGVCAGIADYFEIDPTFVRLAAVVLALASFGVAAIAYIVMMIVVPEEPVGTPHPGPGAAAMGGAPSAPPAWGPVAPGTPPPAPAPPVPPAYPVAAPAAPDSTTPHTPRGGVVFGVVLVLLGVVLLAAQLIPSVHVWQLWPLAIIAIGIVTMFRRGGQS